jgi:hypothetical protein
MELALNLGWLVISAALFVFFRRCVTGPAREQSFWITGVVLVCVVCLLFPVVSMTDDLNSSPAMPEATKSKRLYAPMQVAIYLFSRVLLLPQQEHIRARFIFEGESKLLSEECLPFNLCRRPPPPYFQSL